MGWTEKEINWRRRALCQYFDSEIFFPERGDVPAEKLAKTICNGCSVKLQCLEYSLTQNNPPGIWGGASQRERKRIRRRRARQLIKE